MALLPAVAAPAPLESDRTSTNLSPIAAITACAWSHAVVQAPIKTTRPLQVSVLPPSVPTLRVQLPSWISRSAARTEARVSRLALKMDVKSLTTSSPRSPILRNSPPVAPLLRCLSDVPESRAPSELIVETMCVLSPLRDWQVSVLALPGPEIISNQAGSPESCSLAATASTALRANVIIIAEPFSKDSMDLFEGVWRSACLAFVLCGGVTPFDS